MLETLLFAFLHILTTPLVKQPGVLSRRDQIDFKELQRQEQSGSFKEQPAGATPDGCLEFNIFPQDIQYTDGYVQAHMTIKRLPTFTKQLEFVNGTVQS